MVACDATACWWNHSGFCSAKITILHNGICHRLVRRNGQQIPPREWQHPWFSDINIEDIPITIERVEEHE